MSRILNDDVLIEVLSYLSIEDLLKCQTICRQLKNCSNQVLKQQNCFRIGFGLKYKCFDRRHSALVLDINKAIINIRNNWIESGRDLKASKVSLKPLFSKCVNVYSLEIDDIIINEKVIKFLHKMLKNLICLRIGSLDIISDNYGLVYKQFAKYFGRQLIHLHLSALYIDLEDIEVMKEFPSLEDLSITNFDSISIPLKRLCDSFANNIQKIMISFESKTTIDDLNQFLIHKNTKNIVHLFFESLSLLEQSIDRNVVFSMICKNLNHLENLSLINVVFGTIDPIISSNVLKYFELKVKFRTFISFSSLGLTSLPTIDSLSLNLIDLKPLSLQKIHNLFPNLNELSLNDCRFLCQCVNPCNDCMSCAQSCFTSISMLSHLEVIRLSVSMRLTLQFGIQLNSFAMLSRIELPTFECDAKLLNQFIHFCVSYSQIHNKRWITVSLEEHLIDFIFHNKAIPKNLRIVKLN